MRTRDAERGRGATDGADGGRQSLAGSQRTLDLGGPFLFTPFSSSGYELHHANEGRLDAIHKRFVDSYGPAPLLTGAYLTH